MAFFVLSEKYDEALACTLFFVLSIIYVVVTYERIYGLLIHDEDCEPKAVYGHRGSLRMDDKNRQAMLQQWRNDFDHPLVVNSVRRRMK